MSRCVSHSVVVRIMSSIVVYGKVGVTISEVMGDDDDAYGQL